VNISGTSNVNSRAERLAALVFVFLSALLAAAPLRAQTSKPKASRPLVVVDAGHGGVDPGATGPHGTREKTVTLSVARMVAEILRDETDYEVRMTRDRDTLIALRDRPRLANEWRAAGGADRPALFLSIHCNANYDASARGFESYFLSEAKTEDAKRVEAMENSAQQYETRRPSGDALSFILHDLRQNLYLRDSSAWAELVQTRLATVQTGPERGVKQAGFMVLNGAFMPAVLVEIGFITNPREELLLTDLAAQRRIARELARSVREMLAED
jgi:N-acetylmuramoyl-L-alanine amidase